MMIDGVIQLLAEPAHAADGSEKVASPIATP